MKQIKLAAWLLALLGWASAGNISAQTAPESAKDQVKAKSSATDEVIQLTPFTVTSSANQGYGALLGTSGRLAMPYIDTPQAISIVTSELLKDTKLFDSWDALRFVPNVQQSDGGHNSRFVIRGQPTTAIAVDGFRFAGGRTIIDTGFFDRIEVLKGPSSASFGRSDPVGFINYISKSPTFGRSTETSVTAGTGGPENNLRFMFDNNGLVTEDGKTAYRLVTIYSRGSTTQDFSEFERSGMLLSVDRKLGQRGDLKMTTNVYRNHNPGLVPKLDWSDPTIRYALFKSAGVTLEPDLPLLDPDYQFGHNDMGYTNEGLTTTAVLSYRLSEQWSTRQAVNYIDTDTSGLLGGDGATDVRKDAAGVFVTPIYAIKVISPSNALSYQGDLIWKRDSALWDSNYTLLFGGDVSRGSSYSVFAVTTTAKQPIFNVDRNAAYAFEANVDKQGLRTKGTNWSPYGQLGASFFGGKIQPTVAVRKLYFDNETKNQLNGAITINKNSSPVLGTYSLLFKPRKWLSIYGLNSKYQEPPVVSRKYDGAIPSTDPRYAETYTVQPTTDLNEVGVKGNMFNDKLTFTIAAFKIKKAGAPRRILLSEFLPDGTPVFIFQNFLSDDSTTGWEFEVFGQPTKRLTLLLAGGFLKGDSNVPDPALPVIYSIPRRPGNTVAGTVKYAFGPSPSQGLAAMIGAKAYLSGWDAFSGVTKYFNGVISYPDTNISVDLGFSYGFAKGRYSVDLSVKNAFHKKAMIPLFTNQGIESGRRVFINFDAKF